jgi:hypothetical protein
MLSACIPGSLAGPVDFGITGGDTNLVHINFAHAIMREFQLQVKALFAHVHTLDNGFACWMGRGGRPVSQAYGIQSKLL